MEEVDDLLLPQDHQPASSPTGLEESSTIQNDSINFLGLLASETILTIAQFLSINDLLSWRSVDVPSCVYFENCSIWTTAILKNSECGDDNKFNTSLFRQFLKSRKLANRWVSGKNGPITRCFSVDVYSRIKGTYHQEQSSIPDHLMMDDKNIAVMGREQGACFQLTRVFPPETQQEPLFRSIMDEILVDALCGMSSTVFFYGQTGSGKTHTSLGANETSLDGFVPQTIKYLLQQPNVTVKLRVIEIYCENVHVLVDEQRVEDFDLNAIPLLQRVMRERITRSTASNMRSSRSHAIFSVKAVMRNGNNLLESVINLVDLAGAERQRDDAWNGLRSVGSECPSPLSSFSQFSEQAAIESRRAIIREASKINQSLTTLGRVILALNEHGTTSVGSGGGHHHHIPYRDSKLTLLLKSSLGGSEEGTSSGRTIFLLTISNQESDWREALSTLQFGERARRVRLRTKNESSSSQMEERWQIQSKIYRLRSEMRELCRVWQSCGEGRHDVICRCDRCVERTELEEDDEPMHIPKYVKMVERLRELEERLEEARFMMMH